MNLIYNIFLQEWRTPGCTEETDDYGEDNDDGEANDDVQTETDDNEQGEADDDGKAETDDDNTPQSAVAGEIHFHKHFFFIFFYHAKTITLNYEAK